MPCETLLGEQALEKRPEFHTGQSEKHSEFHTEFTSFRCSIPKMNSTPTTVIQGSFHQGNVDLFGRTAGFQCSCNFLVSICYAKCRRLSLWKSHDIDYILTEGDNNIKRLGFTQSPYVDEFPQTIQIEKHDCSFQFTLCTGEFEGDDIAINFVCEENFQHYDGSIFVSEGYSVAIMKQNFNYYVFDSHSRNRFGERLTENPENGTSILMKFDTLKNLKNYIRQTYKRYNFFQILHSKIISENCNMKSSSQMCNASWVGSYCDDQRLFQQLEL